MRAEERGDERGALRPRELLDDPQLSQLGLAVEAVARLHLDCRGAVTEQRAESGSRERRQLGVGASADVAHRLQDPTALRGDRDRKSTRLNSSHVSISYAVFCLKKKT